MIKSKALSGLVASTPLAVILALYATLRGKELSARLTSTDAFATLSNEQATAVIAVGMVVGSLLLGVAAGLVYGRVESRQLFPVVALGLALLLSLVAVLTQTTLLPDKILGNFATAFVLGCFIPLLAA
ncbi:MAG: hypothetical protein IH587_11005 [Anaerolineae bacterium]|nr:hypothetical protein [Anaerolineae bacterium]